MSTTNNQSTDQTEEPTPAAESKDVEQSKNPGIDYTKDFIWGSDQDEYIDES
ncbi:hypothetical protein [Paenibacillus sp. UNC451MF]|uniref:hypothetical protein n=1 Tax=Paenibacillus sp. UNC451MF TaxID=1449063 RepID=UPI000A755984|nr:hypothetical protein [Paenibacillus sp. UNC451MF]